MDDDVETVETVEIVAVSRSMTADDEDWCLYDTSSIADDEDDKSALNGGAAGGEVAVLNGDDQECAM